MDLVFPPNVTSLNTFPKSTQSLVFVYSPTCSWSIKKAPEFSMFADSYKGPLRLYSLNIKKVPIRVNAVPVLVSSNAKGLFYMSNPDESLEQQLLQASRFALENK